MSSALGPSDILAPGRCLVSPNGIFIAALQGDGNLVVYRVGNNKALWAANTVNKGGVKLIMQDDGNLVLYTANGQAVWASNTSASGDSFARMQDDGNFVVYTQGKSTWATGTNQ